MEQETKKTAGQPGPAADTKPAEPAEEKTADAAETSAGAPQPEKKPETEKDKKAEAKAEKKAEKAEKADPLKAELEKAKAELAKTKDLFLRTAAEYDNYRKRTMREKDAAFGNGVSHAAEKVLPLIDNLEMAAAAETADENYKKGVLMTLDKARKALAELGLEEIPAKDQPFDPQVHSAVMQQKKDGVKPGIVLEVYQKGYTLSGHVVRHAMVVVSE